MHWWDSVRDALDVSLLQLGHTTITLWSLIVVLVASVVIIWGSGLLRSALLRLMQRSGRVDMGPARSISEMVRYLLVCLGLLVALDAAGIDITTLKVIVGAVGVGVGFGLQAITANFISGIVLLVGRPIKVGDRVEVDGIDGDVTEIGARATTVLTNDDIAIVVPNSKFVSESVINWSLTQRRVRIRIPIPVAYGTDVRAVQRLLVELAHRDPDVLPEPAPEVRLTAFGDSSINLELLVWTSTMSHTKWLLVSNLNFAVYDAFKANGIEIPFPQRVVHMRQAARPEG